MCLNQAYPNKNQNSGGSTDASVKTIRGQIHARNSSSMRIAEINRELTARTVEARAISEHDPPIHNLGFELQQ